MEKGIPRFFAYLELRALGGAAYPPFVMKCFVSKIWNSNEMNQPLYGAIRIRVLMAPDLIKWRKIWKTH